MATTEKNANTFDMTSLSAVNSGYSLMLINNSTNEGQLVTMTDLARMIINEIRNQTFTAAELGQASASTLPAAISSLNSATMPFTPIQTNAILNDQDLNDYVNPGTYFCFSQTYSTIANCPVNRAFRMDVIDIKPRASTKYKYAHQIIRTFSSPESEYRRSIQKTSLSAEDPWTFSQWYLIEGTAVSG